MVNQMDNTKTSKYGLIPWKLNKKPLNFLWKRHYRENVIKSDENKRKGEDSNAINVVAPCKSQNNTTNKIQHGFFGNIKKHFAMRKAKQKASSTTVTSDYLYEIQKFNNEAQEIINILDELNNRPKKSSIDIDTEPVEQRCLTSTNPNNSQSNVIQNITDEKKVNCNTQCSLPLNCETDVFTEEDMKDLSAINRKYLNQFLKSSALRTTNELRSKKEIIQCTSNSNDAGSRVVINDENNLNASLTEELLKLSKYGWYWGPISGNEAGLKLMSEPDGAFLVRDSSDDRYLLTLSFKSSGKLLHSRMEHCRGLFSLCNRGESRFTSIPALIDYSMSFSESAVICYSRPKYPGFPSFPVRLTKPVSRFTQVKSLQYLCRFVIRQNTRLDNIHKLPLPKSMKGYIAEAHY